MMFLLLVATGLFQLNTARTSMLISADKGSELKLVHYGQTVGEGEAESFADAGIVGRNMYPAFGSSCVGPCAVSVEHSDGNVTLDLRVAEVRETGMDDGVLLEVISYDEYYPVRVSNFFRTWYDEDVITIWSELSCSGKAGIRVTKYMSGCLPLRCGDVWVTSFYGGWSGEFQMLTEPLSRGSRVFRNTAGTRVFNDSRAEVMIGLDGEPSETSGRTVGAALCWAGNYELEFITSADDYHLFLAGICPDNASYFLEPGSVLKTPPLALSYSSCGMGEVSRNFHRWGRDRMLCHGRGEKMILLNSWEGVGLDVNEEVIGRMMEDFSSLGGELFVVDDGWFGSEYHRMKPDNSLGDWVADRTKLPGGIEGLASRAVASGLKFGLWIEPEMVSLKSSLFRKHPDWVLKSSNREIVCGRGGTQAVLDLCNPKVRDYVVGVIDNLLSSCPSISYLKWDCNMDMKSFGSGSVPHQGNLVCDYWQGLHSVLDRVRASHPDLVIQACGAGGGRANWGVLPWFDEFWPSDNTDALQRVFIQWGCSYFFPSSATGCHVSDVPNKATGRMTSLKYRFDVAMAGRLGLELCPDRLDDDARAFCRRAIGEYKEIRPVVQEGDMYRLVSPYGNSSLASLMYVSRDKSSAVFFWWKTRNMQDDRIGRVRMDGLDPCADYKVREINRIDSDCLNCEGKVFSGRFLMDVGLEMPNKHKVALSERSEWSSRVLFLEKQ